MQAEENDDLEELLKGLEKDEQQQKEGEDGGR